VTENGVTVSKSLIRLNADGTHDPTFKYQLNRAVDAMTMQNNKVIIGLLPDGPNNTLGSAFTASMKTDRTTIHSLRRASALSFFETLPPNPTTKF
jgi:hypothetical protein